MANDIQPLINGVRHSWSSIRVPLFGRTVSGINSISYDNNYKGEDHKGGGGYPVHRTVDFDGATCELELFDYEVDAIMKSLNGRSFKDVAPIDLPVVKKPTGNDGLVTDILHNFQILGLGKSYKAGDGKLLTKVKCIISHVTYNA